MVRLNVFYPRRTGARFDIDYYVNRHLPLLHELLVPMGLAGMQAHVGEAGGPGPASSYVVVASFDFPSREDMRRAMSVHGAAIAADAGRCTDIEPLVQVGTEVFRT